jgi:hypothetical protein
MSPRNLEGHAVGPQRFESGEESTPVPHWSPGGQYESLGADADVTLIRCLRLQDQARAENKDAAHACSLREATTLLF